MDDPCFKALDEESRGRVFDAYHPEIVQKEKEAQEKAQQAKVEAERKNKKLFLDFLKELSKSGQIHARCLWKEVLPLFSEREEFMFLDTHLGKHAARDIFDDFMTFEVEEDFKEDRKVPAALELFVCFSTLIILLTSQLLRDAVRDLNYQVKSDVSLEQFVESILQAHPKTQEYHGKLKKMGNKRYLNMKMFYDDERSGAIVQEKIDEGRRNRKIQRFKDLLHVLLSTSLSF